MNAPTLARKLNPAHAKALAWPPLGVEITAFKNTYATPGNNYAEGAYHETQEGADAEATANPHLRLLTTGDCRTVFEVKPRRLAA